MIISSPVKFFSVNITLDKQDETLASVEIVLTPEDYQPKVDAKLKEVGRRAQLKGFRPGKVPPGLIRKMYGRTILVEELNELLTQSLNDFIAEQKLTLAGKPLPGDEEPLDLDKNEAFAFRFELGLVPDFTYQLDALQAVHYQVEVKPEEVDKVLERFIRQHDEREPVELSPADGMLQATFTNADGTFSHTGGFRIMDVRPEARDRFVGLRAGDTLEVVLSEIFDAEHLNMLPDEVTDRADETLTIEVADVMRVVPATLDQAFFERTGGTDEAGNPKFSDLDTLRSHLSARMKKELQEGATQLLHVTLRQQLIEQTHLPLPEDFLKRWLKQSNASITEEVIADDFDDYLNNTKWEVLIKRIVADHALEVTPQELDAAAHERVRGVYRSMNMAPQEEFVSIMAHQYLRGENSKENFIKLYQECLLEKVYNVMNAEAQITEASVDQEAFVKILEAEQDA